MKRIDWARPQLEVRDLELVLSLGKEGSTAGAASALHISQSAISRALTQAEDRVGAKLFVRSVRGVEPTAAGERLIARAGPLLAELCDAERAVLSPSLPCSRVRLVCECYTAYRWLPSAVAHLRLRVPDLQIEIMTSYTADPVEALGRDQVDIALLTTGVVPKQSSLLERPLFSDEVVFVVATSHPLASANHLSPSDLRRHPLITANTPAAEGRWFMRAVFGRTRPRLQFLRFPLTEAIIDSARAAMGIAVLSEWMASGYLGQGDLVRKRLASGPLLRPWRIAYRRGAADMADRLAELLSSSAPGGHLAASPRSARRS